MRPWRLLLQLGEVLLRCFVLKRAGKYFSLLGLVGVLGFGWLVWRVRPLPPHPFFAGQGVMVIAHQGGDGLRPSNTMAAFEHAVVLGVDVLEMDIHSTADGVIVTIHDATVDRTTDGRGAVQSFTWSELQKLDAGYDWPTLEGREGETARPFRGQGITIPSLEEVLRAFPMMRFNIEIKQSKPSLVEPLCALLRARGLTQQALVASFDWEVISAFRAACPEVATAAVEREIRLFYGLTVVGLSQAFQPRMYAFQVPEYSGGVRVITPEFVAQAHSSRVDVHAWTINKSEEMERMIALGVDGVITDYPDKLLDLLGRVAE